MTNEGGRDARRNQSNNSGFPPQFFVWPLAPQLRAFCLWRPGDEEERHRSGLWEEGRGASVQRIQTEDEAEAQSESLDHILEVACVAPCIKVTWFSCSGGEGEDHRRRLVQHESPWDVSGTERRPPGPEDEGLLGSQEVLQEERQRWLS